MAHDWDKYGDGKPFSIGDWTRDQQFSPPKGKLPKFFKIYADRLIQVSRQMIDDLESRILHGIADDNEMTATDFRTLQMLKAVYDYHITEEEVKHLKDMGKYPRDYLR